MSAFKRPLCIYAFQIQMSLKEAVRAAMSLLECLSELLGYQLSIMSSLINIHVLCGSEYSMKTQESFLFLLFCCLCVFV